MVIVKEPQGAVCRVCLTPKPEVVRKRIWYSGTKTQRYSMERAADHTYNTADQHGPGPEQRTKGTN